MENYPKNIPFTPFFSGALKVHYVGPVQLARSQNG